MISFQSSNKIFQISPLESSILKTFFFFSGQNQTCSYLSIWRLKSWLYRSVSWMWAGTVESHNQIPDCWLTITPRQVKCCKGHSPITGTTKRCPRNGSVPQDWFDWSLRQCGFVGSAPCVLEEGWEPLGWGKACSVTHTYGGALELLWVGGVLWCAEVRYHLHTPHGSVRN